MKIKKIFNINVSNVTEKIINYYRKAKRWNKYNKYLSTYYEYKIYKKYYCCISYKSELSETIVFPHPVGIVIGEGVKIGNNCIIYQNVTIGRKNKDIPEYPTIGNNVTIYSNSTILGNVKIGDNAVIGCNSVVLRDVKKGETVYGIVK